MKPLAVSIPQIVGKGYGAFWGSKQRYRVVKGSRASKKSTTTALWIIASMMKYKESNTLVIRKVYRTIKDSCFAQLKWAVNRLQVQDFWIFKESPLEAIYKPTGQKILFRGLDDPQKVTSITVETGCLCWAWIEEVYEIRNEADFDMLDESIRGEVPEGLFKQITMTFNPWNERHWLKKRFFDNKSDNVLALTTTYQCNEWLSEDDKAVLDKMASTNPRRYKTAGLGDWGMVEGVIYENWTEESYTLDAIRDKYKLTTVCGLDFGYTNDPSAFFIGFLDSDNKVLFVWDEIYKTGLTNAQIYNEIEVKGYRKERIIADSAEPKSIAELRGMGLRITGAQKGPDSIMHGVQLIQGYKIIVHPRCVNFLVEIENYTYDKDKFGNTINRPVDDFNHLMDAMRYAVATSRPRFNTFEGGL